MAPGIPKEEASTELAASWVWAIAFGDAQVQRDANTNSRKKLKEVALQSMIGGGAGQGIVSSSVDTQRLWQRAHMERAEKSLYSFFQTIFPNLGDSPFSGKGRGHAMSKKLGLLFRKQGGSILW